MKERILVCWVGHRDLWAISDSLSPDVREMVRRELPADSSHDTSSPIGLLVQRYDFKEIHLLHTFPPKVAEAFANWLNRPVVRHYFPIKDPTDYGAVYDAAVGVLGGIKENSAGSDCQLAMHLSPGTSTMAAIWVLLGKSLYPATFYQTYKGAAKAVDIPFDLMVDYLPEINRRREAAIEAVVSGATPAGFEGIVGKSRQIKAAIDRARRVAIWDVPVLVLGESGTGKELFARAIHDASGRRGKPFIAINCAAIPRELLESELFGHKKGSFTGAHADRKGAFEQADGGTLFLDEIGECHPDMQAKLLRALQPPKDKSACTRVFRPLGAAKDQEADVRLITATNRGLVAEIQGGRFRADLFYSLATVTIHLPPLRERGGDLPLLAQKLLEEINGAFRRQFGGQYQDKTLSAGAKSFVQAYEWPGNVRELQNVLTQTVVMADGTEISRSDMEAAVNAAGPAMPSVVLDGPIPDNFDLGGHIEKIQRAYLTQAMKQSKGIKTRAAALLGMKNYQTLDAQLKRLRIPEPE